MESWKVPQFSFNNFPESKEENDDREEEDDEEDSDEENEDKFFFKSFLSELKSFWQPLQTNRKQIQKDMKMLEWGTLKI